MATQATTDGICPECGSDRVQAGTDETECLDCGERFQSGLQRLAGRFAL